jgi:hypothetical protein
MIEAVVIAVGGGGAANTLIRQFFVWLRTSREQHTVHLTLKDGNGREATLNVNGLKDSDAITRKVFEFFSTGNYSNE